MKCFRRYLCLSLCFALLLGVSSVTANAEELTLDKIEVTMEGSFTNVDSGESISSGSFTFIPNNEAPEGSSPDPHPTWNNYSGIYTLSYNWVFRSTVNKPLVSKSDLETTVRMRSIYYSMLFWDSSAQTHTYYRQPDDVYVAFRYADGSFEYFHDVEFSVDGTNLSLDFTFTPTDDVREIHVYSLADLDLTVDDNDYVQFYLGEWEQHAGDAGFYISVDQMSEESGLLSTIVSKVNLVYNKVTSGFKDTVENVKEGFSTVTSHLSQLPTKIANKLKSAVSELFIPDDEYIIDYKTRIEELLSEKLGAIYQVIDVTFDSWDRIKASDDTNSIEFPVSTIQITNDTSFSFGGWDVPIVPQGFEFLATAVKSICGVVCTILFVNGLRKRYDEVMGVEK